MARGVIIVESPNKAKTIRQLLGSSYEVLATVGHFRDLPERELGVAVDRQFEPSYVYDPDKKDVVSKLKALKGRYQADAIYVASDADREGEAIGWHIAETIGLAAKQVQRLEFHEITKEGLQRAFKQVRPLDLDLVYAQQARRILDRLVGYKVSPIVRNRLPSEQQLSAGRVQSVALKVVVDRERAIREFKPTESWSVHAHYDAQPAMPSFEAEYVGKVSGAKAPKKQALPKREDAEAIARLLRQLSHSVARIERKETKRQAPAPLITSTMLQQAASLLKMGTDETTRHAKALFEAGLVTYIRTDDPSVSPEFQRETLGYLREQYGPEVVPAKPNIHKAKSANAQGAHECIRPTRLGQTPGDSIEPRARQLYDLITKAYLASQCRPAVFDATEVWIHAGEHALKASGRVLKQPGYLKILDDRDTKETMLPALAQGQALTLLRVEPKQHWSKPPDRFTEATLIKYLEEKGIGRPSTFASMVSLILRKEFVAKIDKKHLAPTERGEKLDAELRHHFATVIHEGFTAQLELDLDRIASSDEQWQRFLATFWASFSPLLEAAQQGVVSRPFTPSAQPTRPAARGGRGRKQGKQGKPTEVPDVKAMFDNPTCFRCGALMKRIRSPKNQREYFCCSRGREACGFIMGVEALENPKCPLCGAPTSRFPSGKGYGCVRWRKDGVNSCKGIVDGPANQQTG
ncbi:MAG TPA: type I DNA topoisomerase [Stenomitos sp.]